jgi:hypothetical protein
MAEKEVPVSRGAEPANRDFTMSSDVGRHLNASTRRPLIGNNPPNLGDVDIVGQLNGTDCIYPSRCNLLGFPTGGPTMTVKIDGVEPNIFPEVHDLDARDAGRHVEVFLDVRIHGNHTPVTIKLSYEQASDLAILLEPFRKP